MAQSYRAGTRGWILLPIALGFVLATALLDGHPGLAPAAWAHAPLRLLSNALPGLLVATLLLAWTRRPLLSALLALAVEGALYGANALKVANLGTPLMPADFRMLGQLGDGGGELLGGYLPHTPWMWLGLLAGLGLLAALLRYERPLTRPARWPGRVLLAVAALALLGTQLAGWHLWRHLYDGRRLGMQPWSASATARKAGLVNDLMLFHLQFDSRRHKADPALATRVLAEQQPAIETRLRAAAKSDGERPDIVVILSESFFDPGILNGDDSSAKVLPNLHRLQHHATWGALHVPTFGGGTIRTEFEVLTGLPLRYFRDIQFPYLQIHQKTIPGIVRTLAADGYRTLAVHGNDPAFWNRTTAFRELGFQRFVSRAQFPADDHAVDGRYMSDKAFTDELLRQLPDAGPPRFVLGISIEAHGPYDHDYGIDTHVRDAIPVPASITGGARTQLQNYLYHAHHADQQLGRLVDTLARRKRRTLILFFGDHLPAIVPAFQQAGFRNGQGFLVQTVPYLLIDTAHMHHAHHQDAAAWELPGMLLDRAGVGTDAYFALTQLVAPQLASLTRAPDAPPPAEDETQKTLDQGMADIATLRLRGHLDAMWARLLSQRPMHTASTQAVEPHGNGVAVAVARHVP